MPKGYVRLDSFVTPIHERNGMCGNKKIFKLRKKGMTESVKLKP